MVENFKPICCDKGEIDRLLRQFGDAIGNKQYRKRISYDAYRKIKDSQIVFISVKEDNILITSNSTTLFCTSYKDDGFGQFLYDNYASITRVVETKTNIKENDTMKMPSMNFDFGPFTDNIVALSPYGIAVRNSNNEYLTYNAATGSIAR